MISRNPMAGLSSALSTQAKSKDFLAREAEKDRDRNLKMLELRTEAAYQLKLSDEGLLAHEDLGRATPEFQKEWKQDYWSQDQFQSSDQATKDVFERVRLRNDSKSEGGMAALIVNAETLQKQENVQKEVSRNIVDMDARLERAPTLETKLEELENTYEYIDLLVEDNFGTSDNIPGQKQRTQDWGDTLKQELLEAFVYSDNVDNATRIEALRKMGLNAEHTQALYKSLPDDKVSFDTPKTSQNSSSRNHPSAT
jgi:hypothetical protein